MSLSPIINFCRNLIDSLTSNLINNLINFYYYQRQLTLVEPVLPHREDPFPKNAIASGDEKVRARRASAKVGIGQR